MAGKANTIKNTIILEGEKQYKKSMADITNALKESKSAQRAAAAEFKASGEDMRQAAAYSEALADTYSVQSRQLDEMERHLKDVEEKYGTNSREAMQLRTKINNVRTEMAKTQIAMQQMETQMDGLADGGGDAARGMDAMADAAHEATNDVDALAESIADAVGRKTIEFVIGGAALDKLKDGLKAAVSFAIDEAVDGQKEYGFIQSGTGDAALTESRLDVKDEIDKRWSGRLDGMQTAAAVETVDTVLDNMSLTDPDRVVEIANAAIFQQERFGVSAGEQMERADAMVKTFGEDWERTFDLMTLGFQNSHDGGALMLKTFDENAQAFKQMGYDADDMFSVILSAVNNEELGKDSNLNKGMLSLIDSVTNGSKEQVKALRELGIETTDLSEKVQQGGETAAKGYGMVLEKLVAVTDEAKRNELGKAIFGDKVWTSTGGEIASALLAGFGQTIEADGVTQMAMGALLDNVSDNFSGFVERVGQMAGDAAEPIVDAANTAFKELNKGIDEGDILSGVGKAVIAWGDGLHETLDPILGVVVDGIDKRMGEASKRVSEGFYGGAQENVDAQAADETARRWIGVLQDSVDSAASATKESTTLESMLDGMLPDTTTPSEEMKTFAKGHKDAVVAQMQEVYGQENDEDFEAWKLFQTSMINSAYDDTTEQSAQLGTDAAQAEIHAVEQAEPDANAAGMSFGEAAVSGAEDGLSDMEEAGEDGADGLVAGLSTSISGAYNKGYAAGKAFERGYRNATDTHSPSRRLRLASQDVIAGAMEPLERAESAVYARGAALGAALEDGYRGRAQGGVNAPGTGAGGAEGISPDALAEAITAAISGLALYASGEKIGQVGAASAGRAMSRAGLESIAGRANAARSW